MWNLDGSTGGLGKVALTNYGSYASSLTRRAERQPALRPARRTRCRSAGCATSPWTCPDTAQPGQTFTATATVRGAGRRGRTASGADGRARRARRLDASSAASPASVGAGASPADRRPSRWQVQPPTGDLPSRPRALTATVHYRAARPAGHRQRRADHRRGTAAPPPAGTDAVSDLPFLSATNGWGPVERDSSVGEQAAGRRPPDHHRRHGVRQGPGHQLAQRRPALPRRPLQPVHRDGGRRRREGRRGHGHLLRARRRQDAGHHRRRSAARQAAVAIDVDVTGAQVLDLVVGDGGDGNGNDHGDWAVPDPDLRLTAVQTSTRTETMLDKTAASYEAAVLSSPRRSPLTTGRGYVPEVSVPALRRGVHPALAAWYPLNRRGSAFDGAADDGRLDVSDPQADQVAGEEAVQGRQVREVRGRVQVRRSRRRERAVHRGVVGQRLPGGGPGGRGPPGAGASPRWAARGGADRPEPG